MIETGDKQSKKDKQMETGLEDAQKTIESSSAQPMKNTVPADRLYRTLDGINEVLSDSGKVQGRIEVTLNTGTSFCYLSTTDMSIHYLTPAQNVVDGNLALQWVTRAVPNTPDGKRISNVVTDEANEDPKPGDPQTFLNVGNAISQMIGSSQSRSLVVEGPPNYVFKFIANPSDPTEIAITTEYNTDTLYLQPSNDGTHSIIAVTQDLVTIDYPFKFPIP